MRADQDPLLAEHGVAAFQESHDVAGLDAQGIPLGHAQLRAEVPQREVHRLAAVVHRRLQPAQIQARPAQELLDDATTNAIAHVFRNQLVADLRVGVRIDHPRVSDLVLHLVSPSGTRVVLAENRGGPDGADFGFGTPQVTSQNISSIGGPAQTNIDYVRGQDAFRGTY